MLFLKLVNYSKVSGRETGGIFRLNKKTKDVLYILCFKRKNETNYVTSEINTFLFLFEISKTMKMHLTNATRLECKQIAFVFIFLQNELRTRDYKQDVGQM